MKAESEQESYTGVPQSRTNFAEALYGVSFLFQMGLLMLLIYRAISSVYEFSLLSMLCVAFALVALMGLIKLMRHALRPAERIVSHHH